jgi:hypothetical protein
MRIIFASFIQFFCYNEPFFATMKQMWVLQNAERTCGGQSARRIGPSNPPRDAQFLPKINGSSPRFVGDDQGGIEAPPKHHHPTGWDDHACDAKSISSRPPTRPPTAFFYIRTAVFGPAAPPVPRFCPDLGFHPSGEPRSSPAFRGALGDSERNENA